MEGSVRQLAKQAGVTWSTMFRRLYPDAPRLKEYKIRYRDKTRAREKARQYSRERLIRDKLDGAKRRSIRDKVDFNLTYRDLANLLEAQSQCCSITGFELQIMPGFLNTFSLDRIVPSIGYIRDNVRWVCQFINLAAMDRMTELLEVLSAWDTTDYDMCSPSGWYIINPPASRLSNLIMDTYRYLVACADNDGYFGTRLAIAKQMNMSDRGMKHRFNVLESAGVIGYKRGDLIKSISKSMTGRLSAAKHRSAPCTVNLRYLLDMFREQNGKCKLSGMRMTPYGLTGVSMDAIDPAIGHIHGNVQLTCHWVNCGKNKHTNAEAQNFIDRLRYKYAGAL